MIKLYFLKDIESKNITVYVASSSSLCNSCEPPFYFENNNKAFGVFFP